MKNRGFDSQKYIQLQSQRIRERIAQFGGKLYLEFGGKLFDDYHASRVLPGFAPDNKIRMLLELKDQAEIVIAINAGDIEKSKLRGDLGITYETDVVRLIDVFRDFGLYVGSIALTQYTGQPTADLFTERMGKLGLKVYRLYRIPNYPSDVKNIVSDNGYGKNDYIETTRSLVVVTAPGPGSGKMATCLSQLYHEHKRGVKAGYAKFETFPIWNLPLKHPVNLAYEAATADLNDVNMIDPFHLEAYGETTVNYNREIEIFPVLKAIFERIYGECPYKSPTDMGVNMAGYSITDDEVCREASRQEVVRRYFKTACLMRQGRADEQELNRLELLMRTLSIDPSIRKTVPAALEVAKRTNQPATAIELPRQNLVTARRVVRGAVERAEDPFRYSGRTEAHLPQRHRTDSASEGRSHGQSQPAPAHRRGAHRARHQRRNRPNRRPRNGRAFRAQGLRRAFDRHSLPGRRRRIQKARHERHLRARLPE